MSNESAAMQGGPGRGRALQFVYIVAVFVFLGPVFGFLSLAAVTALFSGLMPPFGTRIVLPALPPFANVLNLAETMYGLSLLFGGLQALLVGMVAALAFTRSGRVPLTAVLIGAAFACTAFLFVIVQRTGKGVDNIALLVLPHFTAAVGCWLLVARLRTGGAR